METINTLSFFGDNGISATSANHIANLAKESVRDAHERLAATRFYSEKVGLLTSSHSALVHAGMSTKTLNALPELVDQIAQAHSLIAYLREAIKEKERLMKEAQNYTDEEAYNLIVSGMDAARLDKPVREKYPTEEDIKKTWSIGEQEKFLSLGAEAAALGKFVHEDGFLSAARIDLMHKIQNPNSVQLNGSDTIVHNYEQTVALSDVDSLFNSLQAKYRSVQAELNGMKKKIEDTIQSKSIEIDNAYNERMREYNAKMKEYDCARDTFMRDMEIERKNRVRNVQTIKIVIPNRLKPIYDKLNSLK